jgi:hypothetical protein
MNPNSILIVLGWSVSNITIVELVHLQMTTTAIMKIRKKNSWIVDHTNIPIHMTHFNYIFYKKFVGLFLFKNMHVHHVTESEVHCCLCLHTNDKCLIRFSEVLELSFVDWLSVPYVCLHDIKKEYYYLHRASGGSFWGVWMYACGSTRYVNLNKNLIFCATISAMLFTCESIVTIAFGVVRYWSGI